MYRCGLYLPQPKRPKDGVILFYLPLAVSAVRWLVTMRRAIKTKIAPINGFVIITRHQVLTVSKHA